MSIRYEFEAEVWLYQGKGAWHFVTTPAEVTAGLNAIRGPKSRGWGSLRVAATIGATTWRTSLFPDSKRAGFLLPIKAEVRAREGLGDGDQVAVSVEVLL